MTPSRIILSPHKEKKNYRRIYKTCPQCHRKFWTNVCYSERKFCSLACYRASIHEPILIKTCIQCGRDFKCRDNATTKIRKCCSQSCAYEFFRGSNHPLYRGKRKADRGWTWKQRREMARERDGEKCQSIIHSDTYTPWREEKCSVDHVIPYRVVMGWRKSGDSVDPNSLDNLICLCRRCHQIKTSAAEVRLLHGDVAGFLGRVREILGQAIVDRALWAYGRVGEDIGKMEKNWEYDRRPAIIKRESPGSRGKNHWKVKFSEEQIVAIKRRKNESRKKLALEFGMKPQYVSQIINGHKWSHVTI